MMKKLFLTISLVFASLLSFSQEAKIIDRIVAVVGNNIIMQSDIEGQYIEYRLRGGVKGDAESIRCDILEDLLFQKLMLNEAEIDSITVTEEQINSEVESRIRFFMAQLGSQEKMEAYFNKSIKDIKEELHRVVKESALVQQVQHKIVSGLTVTPAEVRRLYNDMPYDSIPMVPAQYEIVHLVKKPPITMDEKLIVKERLYQLRRRILDGERFSTLALLYSEDPGSAKKGGELGFHGRGEFDPNFEAAAFNLRDGEISEVIESEFGYHIIQMIERRGDYVNVRHILLTVKVAPEQLQIAYDELDSIAQLIRDDSLTFDEAVKKFSEEEDRVNGGYLVNDVTGSTLFTAEELPQTVSNYIMYLNEGEITGPVPMKTDKDKDALRLLLLKRKTQPHRATIADDYTLIQQWAMQKKREETLEKWIQSKAKKAYIKINPDFENCDFKYSWK